MGKIKDNYFANLDNQNQKMSIQDMLEKDETILWEGKPKKSAFICSAFIKMLPIAIIWLAFDLFFIVNISKFSGEMEGFTLMFIIFFIIHLAPVWIWLYNIIHAALAHKNIHYALTDKKIIIRSGVIGIDFKMVNYAEVSGVRCNVGLLDKLFKVGDIYIKSINQSIVINDIKNPYEVYNRLVKIVNDIKADMSFPNAYRPEENNGYQTKYKG